MRVHRIDDSLREKVRWVLITQSHHSIVAVSYTHLDVYKRQVRKEAALEL